MEQTSSSRLSVFQDDKRITNDLESFHTNLKREFCSHSPNYWVLVQKLNNVIKTTKKEMERIDKNIPIHRIPTPHRNVWGQGHLELGFIIYIGL